MEFDNGLLRLPTGNRRTLRGKSLDHRYHGHAGNLHGAPRQGYCEGLIAAHRRRSRRQLRREHLGPHELSGIERRRSAAFRVAEQGFWAQTLLHALRRAVHFELSPLRTRSFIELANLLFACCRASAVAGRLRSSRPFSWTHFLLKSGPQHSLSTAWQSRRLAGYTIVTIGLPDLLSASR